MSVGGSGQGWLGLLAGRFAPTLSLHLKQMLHHLPRCHHRFEHYAFSALRQMLEDS